MKRIVLIALAGLILCSPAFGFGREAHETVAKIAENHLKPSVKKKIEKYLGGKSIVYYAKWMDDYRHTPEYGFTTKWHVASVDKDFKYVHNAKDGDAVYGLNLAIEALKNYKELPDSAVAVNLKYIIHLVGDFHCPVHIYYEGKSQKFKTFVGPSWEKRKMAYHTAWDLGLIQANRFFSTTEWADEIDRVSKKEVAQWVEGTPQDWFEQSARDCYIQWELVMPDKLVTQDAINVAMPLIENQILKAGHRLAYVLNNLF